MKQFSDYIKGYGGQNPFSDSQARNFSDKKVIEEFYPISKFWTLFNDQHEILLGTRGSGKTFLLKMMRYSMLKKIEDPEAKKIVKEKEFIAIYVPMHLEFVAPFKESGLDEEMQIAFFQFGFNCILAQAMLVELKSIIDDVDDKLLRVKTMVSLVEILTETWFEGTVKEIYDFDALSSRILQMYYTIDWKKENLESIPSAFKRQICTPLLIVKDKIRKIASLEKEPTWIICVDEAEFLNETMQKCINNIFRSDSNRIALKVATLPYYHKTLETLVENVTVSDGNDFSFRVVDMDFDSSDFVSLTNKLCAHRLKDRFNSTLECCDLESFLGRVGKDDQIDYYRLEKGNEEAEKDNIEKRIIDEFSPKRRNAAVGYTNKRKTIYDKYAPIFFIREMFKESSQGNRKPGWFAGAKNIRKLSQGNPRIFIQIMNDLFEKARQRKLTPKVQYEVVMDFSKKYCEATQALEKLGPIIYKNLNFISEYLHNKVHNQYLTTTGAAFTLKYNSDAEFEKAKEWIELAIAYSRLCVDDEVKICGIKQDTKFALSNIYTVVYWLPTRADTPLKISLSQNVNNMYIVKSSNDKLGDWQQLSLFDEVKND